MRNFPYSFGTIFPTLLSCALGALLLRCSSAPDVLSEVPESVEVGAQEASGDDVQSTKSAQNSTMVESTPAVSAAPPHIPTPSERLAAALSKRGIEGVGLTLESGETQKFLLQVVEHPDFQNRDIALLYTGAVMAYDSKARSLTVGGGQLETAIAFVRKHCRVKQIPRPKKK